MDNPQLDKDGDNPQFAPKEANRFLAHAGLVVLGMLFGYLFVNQSTAIIHKSTKFDELMNLIRNNYVDTLNYNQIEDHAVNQLLSSLDPHSVYIPKEELAQSNEPLEGNFEGVGIEFFIANDTLVVVSPINGGASEQAGIKPGDKILKINDTTVAGVHLKNADVFKKLRGQKGTTVKLGILRNGKFPLLQYTIKRNTIEVNSVEKGILVAPKIGYIKINSFGEKTHHEFQTELKKLVDKDHIENLVIDLRQNTGGYLETAVSILDELIDQNKLLVYTKGRNYPSEKYISKTKGLYETGGLAVLIDEGSASASEIVAGAVQDLDRGVIIGRRSFGKGLVQSQLPLSDGSAVRLTVAKYYTPSGRNIQKPYTGGLEKYEEEIYNRYSNGEMFDEKKQQIADTTSFYTTKGRKVKGGGGIYPDIFVPIDTQFDMHNFSILRSNVPDFVYSNHEMLQSKVEKYSTFGDFDKNFQIDKDLFGKFISYVQKQKIPFNLKRLASYEKKLKGVLKAYIAKQFYGNEGFLKILNESDPMILKAENYFKNPQKQTSNSIK